MNFSAFIFALVLFFNVSCSHSISEDMRKKVDENLSFAQLIESPKKFKGQMVMLGGVIVKTKNFPDRTEVEVINKELDHWGYPDRGDSSLGRFIFTRPGFLDPQIYTKGRYLLGVGKVQGSFQGKVDKQTYLYPVVAAEELHLLRNLSDLNDPGPYYGSYGRFPLWGRLGLFPYYW
tara:strand:+ start:1249 stop:1776 length:528 start_codon:yes stop_codon:yes gene_type:complete